MSRGIGWSRKQLPFASAAMTVLLFGSACGNDTAEPSNDEPVIAADPTLVWETIVEESPPAIEVSAPEVAETEPPETIEATDPPVVASPTVSTPAGTYPFEVVEDVFAPAAWSARFDRPAGSPQENIFVLRPDRLVVLQVGTNLIEIHALDDAGTEVWSIQEQQTPINTPHRRQSGTITSGWHPFFVAGADYVGWFSDATPEATGIEIAEPTAQATIVSIADGSVVAQGAPEETFAQLGFTLPKFNSPLDVAIPADSELADWPFAPSLAAQLYDDPTTVIDPQLGVIWKSLDTPRGTIGDDSAADWHLTDLATGQVITPADELPCLGDDREDTDGRLPPMRWPAGHVLSTSPNGQYGVFGQVRYTRDGAECIAGIDGLRDVQFVAIDDDGTAYGLVLEPYGTAQGDADGREFAVVPLTDPARIVITPDRLGLGNVQTKYPFGFMTGNLAIHRDQISTISANPLR